MLGADETPDLHPDLFYKPYTSTDKSCHRGSGDAGIFGAEVSDCDTPVTLINATFQWLNDNIRDTIDFVIWTGDSARHDNDDKIPRNIDQVVELNELIVTKFTEVFGKADHVDDPDPTNDFVIPVVPTFGNNDIMPHNIMHPGPNVWTNKFSHIWRNMIPEEQKHAFERGGWFFVEVIPNKLAVFNVNTMYFFKHNSAVDGCAKKSEPGYQQMQWLRTQLQLMRDRGLKIIIMGHVPPASTDNKKSWDSTCWQLYALWMKQYRDVVVGSMYGHMNIDHFMLQDFHDIKKKTKKGRLKSLCSKKKQSSSDEMSIQSSEEYLTDLRDDWAKIPDAPEPSSLASGPLKNWWDDLPKQGKKHKSKEDKYLKKIGGEWAERYSVSLVTASVVPNYFPSFRVIEYNITGVDNIPSSSPSIPAPDDSEDATSSALNDDGNIEPSSLDMNKKHKKKKPKKPKKPRYTIPSPPPKSSPPGPAYSSQPFTWLGYKQYYANLTRINAAFNLSTTPISTNIPSQDETSATQEHNPRNPDPGTPAVMFEFELEYDTSNDTIYSLPDLTVRSYVDLARRIGKYDPDGSSVLDDHQVEGSKKRKHKHEKKKKKQRKRERKEAEKLWFTFLRRAYVGAKGDEELREEFAGL